MPWIYTHFKCTQTFYISQCLEFCYYFIVSFNCPSFIFHYFIFYGKIASKPITAVKMCPQVLVEKMSMAKMLKAKVPRTSSNTCICGSWHILLCKYHDTKKACPSHSWSSLTEWDPGTVRYSTALVSISVGVFVVQLVNMFSKMERMVHVSLRMVLYPASFLVMKIFWSWIVVTVAQHCEGTKCH